MHKFENGITNYCTKMVCVRLKVILFAYTIDCQASGKVCLTKLKQRTNAGANRGLPLLLSRCCSMYDKCKCSVRKERNIE